MLGSIRLVRVTLTGLVLGTGLVVISTVRQRRCRRVNSV